MISIDFAKKQVILFCKVIERCPCTALKLCHLNSQINIQYSGFYAKIFKQHRPRIHFNIAKNNFQKYIKIIKL